MNREKLIAAGFGLFRATQLHRLAAPWTRGQGAILMFHHVRPWHGGEFAPNRLLEITPDFLDVTIRRVRANGFDILGLDEAVASLGQVRRKPFAVLTFDDGYIDNELFALPVLEKHAAPFTLFATTGFADRTARLWWIELERAIATLPRLPSALTGLPDALVAETNQQKMLSFKTLYEHLRAGSEENLLRVIAGLARAAGIETETLPGELCLDWDGIARLARHPLCTIGAHTLTHPMLAKHPESVARAEIADSKRLIEERIQRPVRHLAYPVGDAGVAGAREFRLAAEAGFASAVTTRPGMIFPSHANQPTALPRLSINGRWQRLDVLDVLLSGAAFALWNLGRARPAAA